MSQSHARRNALLVLAAFLTLALTVAACGSKTAPPAATGAGASAAPFTDMNGVTCTHTDPATGLCPGDTTPATTAPAPSPTPVPPTKVTFTITGYAPGDGYGNGPTINYGSNASTHEASPADRMLCGRKPGRSGPG